MDNREHTLREWLNSIFPSTNYTLSALAGDASFRRYFRLQYNNQWMIIMDAPPEKESLKEFIDIATRLRQQKISAPQILHQNHAQGFLVLEDFGDILLHQKLTDLTVNEYYQKAMDSIISMQNIHADDLPHFNIQHMLQEMQLMPTWFLKGYLGLSLSQDEMDMLDSHFHWIANTLATQPSVFIHRDFHSRNIMCISDDELGIIDFQDAMFGPYTYDLVSLIKDCYIQWPRDKINAWISSFYSKLPMPLKAPKEQLLFNQVEVCGLQRHIKVLGIFSRLYIRDNKPGYLQDLPLTLNYVLEALENIPECKTLYEWFKQNVVLP
jgi:aminoglycoside/choline kinase family phosphotransferase